MRRLQNLIVGWGNTNIRSAVETGMLARFSYVLITSIDSATDLSVPSMKSGIAHIDPQCWFLGRGVVVQGQSMVKLAEDRNLFTGFDELWCFDRRPSTPKPDDLWIVAPTNIETDLDRVALRLVSWMAEADCKLGLGDGIGLNYATTLEELANKLEQLSH
jgi:hypothetical protein